MTARDLPPVFCISLARAKERREAMRARLNNLGTQYEFVDAVDGATMDAALYESRLRQDKFRRKFGRDMLPGEIGCYLSHYNLWRRIVGEKIPCALVLEDDAAWDDDLLSVCAAVEMLEWRWGVVLLSGKKAAFLRRVLATVGDKKRLLVMFGKRMATTAGYMISQRGAAMLLDYCREISAPVDIAYGEWWRNKIPFYCVVPPPVWQTGLESLVVEGRKKRASFSNRVRASLWRKRDRWHCRLRYFLIAAQGPRGE